MKTTDFLDFEGIDSTNLLQKDRNNIRVQSTLEIVANL